MNNNKKQSERSYGGSEKNPNLQFTKLTPDDIAEHEDTYINMLVSLAPKATGISNISARMYYEYAIKEVQKANDIFQRTFG